MTAPVALLQHHQDANTQQLCYQFHVLLINYLHNRYLNTRFYDSLRQEQRIVFSQDSATHNNVLTQNREIFELFKSLRLFPS